MTVEDEPPHARGFEADRGDTRLRLDQAIVRHLGDVPRISRTRVQRWIDDGLVLVNGRPARRASSTVAAGDLIVVGTPAALERRAVPQAERLDLEILFEDEHFLAVNKPAGLVAHPSYKNPSGTLLNALLGYVQLPVRPSLAQRLDKHTSGVLLVAKSPGMHARLQRALQRDGARKEYLAVVFGRPRPARGTIALPLARDPGDRRRVIVHARGQESETRYEVIASRRGLSLVRCELVTGRTHQIRVHLSAGGWPIVGDQVYGDRTRADRVTPADAAERARSFGRQALHAWRVTLPHPESGAAITITAPVPEDVRGLLSAFTKWRP